MKHLVYFLILTLFNLDRSFALLDSELAAKYKHSSRFNAVGRVVRADGTFATGTLIAPNVVLTAAHVLKDPDCYNRQCSNDGLYYTGKFHGTVNFEIESDGKTYLYRAK